MPIKNLSSQQEAYALYDFKGLLGEGAYGFVYAGVDKARNEPVAIKTMTFAKSDFNAIAAEIDLLFSLRSKYVVSIVEALQFDNQIWIVMECCEGGALNDVMRAVHSPLGEAEAVEVVAHTLLALQHCHANKIIHRDLKAANLLLHRNGSVKLADFGNSAQLEGAKKKRNTMIGTAHFISPEMAKGQSYDAGLDVWSLGITLYELCEGHPPYANKADLKVVALIASRASPKLKDPSLWSSDCHHFLAQCLEQDVAKRPSVAELMEHIWVKQCCADISREGAAPGSPNLKKYFNSSIRAIIATRHQDDSSDESDNEHDFADISAEEEAARLKAEQEAVEQEAARLLAEQEAAAVRRKSEHEEAAKLKLAEEEARVLAAEQEAARLLAAEQEAARLLAEQEAAAVRRKSEHEEAAKLKLAEEEARGKDDEETAPRTAKTALTTKPAPSPSQPRRFSGLAKKQNKNAFKMSEWKAAYFVLDDGVLKYFRSEADYLHNRSLQEGPSTRKPMKKENRYQLSVRSSAQLQAATKHVVEVSDSAGGWSVLIKCEDEERSRAWLNNIEEQLTYLGFIADESASSQQFQKNKESSADDEEEEEEEEEEDEFEALDEYDFVETVTTATNVNKFINKLREKQKHQEKAELKRVNARLSMRRGRADSTVLPAEVHGWAHKRTDHSHHWKRRFLVVENSTIKYFLTDKNTEPQGTFILSPSSTVEKEGHIIKIHHVKGTHDGGESQLASTALAIKFDEEDWVLETWMQSIQDHINHSTHAMLPAKLKRLSLI
eukprot:CAMPEP_0114423924 /NCGR_PEP_ID=MMETSP0103-20121206/6413_1 /TAXON_ID=37642 ORGANISM="Paraphysomonas imperforata, Strain PA2" /NCGR_SAMPLE_ID=MMETSP0103 /ASSEMBLY_ACC=CAM_ASM_000201 /LENGTH=778 /DNA_ID=CAMNT_0001592629 /DNA_START=54 /DNA_END=2390 /DNA_ORIENTATION=-